MKKLWALPVLFLLPGVPALAQQFPPGFVDPMPLLAAASEEIGEENFQCVTFSGTDHGNLEHCWYRKYRWCCTCHFSWWTCGIVLDVDDRVLRNDL